MRTSMVNRHRVDTDYHTIRCVLEMDSDGYIAVIVKPGCSVSDAHDMLQQLMLSGGRFEHLTFVDDDEEDWQAPTRAPTEYLASRT